MKDPYITELLLTWVIKYTRHVAQHRFRNKRNKFYENAEPRTIQEDFITWLNSNEADTIADDMADGLEPFDA